MEHVFISYVRQNQEIVDKLYQELTLYGIDVWLDRQDLGPGTNWKRAIRKAIRQGSFFIACFSKEYSELDRTYMNEELTLAIEEIRQHSTDRVWFIPLKLNECEIPDLDIGAGKNLGDITYVKLHGNWNDGIQRVLNMIRPKSPKQAEIEAKLYHQIIRGRLEIIDTFQRQIKQGALEVIIHRYLYENLWLLDPSWDKATETPLMAQTVAMEFDGINVNLTQAERSGRFDIKYKKTSGTHVIIELKHPSRTCDDYQLLAQTDVFRTSLEKLIKKSGQYEPVEVVCIVGKPLRQWTTSASQSASKRMLAEKNTRVILYDEIIDGAYRRYRDFLDASKQAKMLIN